LAGLASQPIKSTPSFEKTISCLSIKFSSHIQKLSSQIVIHSRTKPAR
jgi:hypothetical protein